MSSDVVGDFMRAVALRSAAAPALAFAAGMVSSVGPCLGTRVVSLNALIEEQCGLRRYAISGAFVVGLVLSYVLIASCAALWMRAAQASSAIYAVLALGLIAFGVRSLVHSGSHVCKHRLAGHRISLGWALVSGASLAFVASPCCTPVIASIAGLANAGAPQYALSIAAFFATGHALPLLVTATGTTKLSQALQVEGWGTALSVVNGGILLALGAYYAVLA